ncbi:MAG: hypothetical protein R6U84_02090 [Candidatus Cloacimonadales bacterium]
MKYLISLYLVLSSVSALAISDAVENILLNEEETYYATELFQQLDEYEQHPLNINTATAQQLKTFIWLSEDEIAQIIALRRQADFNSAQDLAKTGIAEINLDALLPYIKFEPSPKLNFSYLLRLELSEKKMQLDSPLKLLQKLEMTYDNSRWGLVTQKDAEETNYLDYYSYFWEVQHRDLHLILGKYRIMLGQGILFAPKLGISKSAAATSVGGNRNQLFRPYTSSYEIWELQGAALEWDYRNLKFATFGSFNQLTANLADGVITSFDQTGIHLDADKKHNVDEVVAGAIVGLSYRESKIDLYFASQNFDREIADDKNKYLAWGSSFYLLTGDYPFLAEYAQAAGKHALLVGKKWGEARLRQLLLYRYYQADFPTWHGKPFAAQNNFENENGLYYGLTYLPATRFKINAYFDFWQHQEPRYLEKMPTSNSEQLLQAEYKINQHNFRIRLQHKFKERQINLDESMIRDFQRTTFRFDWLKDLGNFSLKQRYEFSSEYLPNQQLWKDGELFFSQLQYQSQRLQLIGRIAVYQSKILLYMYENNVSGIMQNRILSGDGITAFVVIKAHLTSALEIQAKLSDNLSKSKQRQFTLQLISSF